VNVNVGTLGGKGTIAGSVTVGTGAAEVVPTDESTFSANGNPSKLAMKAAMDITLRRLLCRSWRIGSEPGQWVFVREETHAPLDAAHSVRMQRLCARDDAPWPIGFPSLWGRHSLDI